MASRLSPINSRLLCCRISPPTIPKTKELVRAQRVSACKHPRPCSLRFSEENSCFFVCFGTHLKRVGNLDIRMFCYVITETKA